MQSSSSTLKDYEEQKVVVCDEQHQRQSQKRSWMQKFL